MSDPFALSRLNGRVAVITGAAQGIGEATARLFAERGIAGLVLADRNAQQGEAVARSLQDQGVKAVFVGAELADPAQVARVIPPPKPPSAGSTSSATSPATPSAAASPTPISPCSTASSRSMSALRSS